MGVYFLRECEWTSFLRQQLYNFAIFGGRNVFSLISHTRSWNVCLPHLNTDDTQPCFFTLWSCLRRCLFFTTVLEYEKRKSVVSIFPPLFTQGSATESSEQWMSFPRNAPLHHSHTIRHILTFQLPSTYCYWTCVNMQWALLVLTVHFMAWWLKWFSYRNNLLSQIHSVVYCISLLSCYFY